MHFIGRHNDSKKQLRHYLKGHYAERHRINFCLCFHWTFKTLNKLLRKRSVKDLHGFVLGRDQSIAQTLSTLNYIHGHLRQSKNIVLCYLDDRPELRVCFKGGVPIQRLYKSFKYLNT